MNHQVYGKSGVSMASDRPVLHAEALSKAYGQITVLSDVTLDIV